MTPNTHSTPRQFNALARLLHWLMALAILAMLFIGVGMTTSLTWRPWLIDLHRPLGIAILLLACLRIINRLNHTPPALPDSLPGWQHAAAKLSHILLYALMIGVPLLGWASLSAGNWPVTLVPGWDLPAISPTHSTLYAVFHSTHSVLAWLMFFVVLGHLAAALMHAWVLRDGVFSTMTGLNQKD